MTDRLFGRPNAPVGQFAGKVALVTGGASGIGRATAVAFGAAGARVVIADLDDVGGSVTMRQIVADGGEAVFVRTDVTRDDEVDAMVAAAILTYGRLDCAFNNAGIVEGGIGKTAEVERAVWERVLAVNLTGVWLCLKHEIPVMLRQGSGAIVNTASVAGLRGLTGSAAYVASKHGVVGLTRAAALDYATTGVRINAVCPAAIRTPMLEASMERSPGAEAWFTSIEPVGRIGAPEEVAAAVLWLCSDAASFVTGHALPVDGGALAGWV